MRRRTIGSIGGALLMAASACAQTPVAAPPPKGDTTPADYAQDAAWICRPGVDDGTCSTNLDAMDVDAKGTRVPEAWAAAKDAKIDCFYIYPTVSNDPTLYSDMNAGPEERRTVHSQLARFGAKCRLFAPIYHQFTNAALRYSMSAPAGGPELDFNPAYEGVLAAWKSYLARDNKGRGVVLIGHSQGAILLKRLIAEEIDGRPAQKLLVGAYLAGNLDLTSKAFRAIQPCAAAGQTGCVTAWSSYLETDTSKHFFASAAPGAPALCVNPAAPGGDRGMLKAYLAKPSMAAPSDPPYVQPVGQISAECVTDATGTVLRIRVEPGPTAELMGYWLSRYAGPPGWGLHILDVNLVQGNIADMIQAQSAAWAKAH